MCAAVVMIVALLTLIFYRFSSSDSRSHPQLIRGTTRHHSRKGAGTGKMEDINEFSTMTQSPSHLAKQKAYEARIMADVRNRAEEGRVSRRLLYPHIGSYKENNVVKSVELRRGPPLIRGDRIVHLDLKGAPPRMGYYEELFPLLKALGATGVLIEYEDMFPYSGQQLQDFPAYNAYSKSDIKGILKLASTNGLQVIPLIQTFGHMEFILKLHKYAEMREVHRYPQVIKKSYKQAFLLSSDPHAAAKYFNQLRIVLQPVFMFVGDLSNTQCHLRSSDGDDRPDCPVTSGHQVSAHWLRRGVLPGRVRAMWTSDG